jgi:pyruvate,water dikinase
VQSRPITTLFPVPDAEDEAFHVFISVGHQQMMTDAMKPLGLSVFALASARPMYRAGGRLFVDVSTELTSPAKRNILLNYLGKSDPLTTNALKAIIERGDLGTTEQEKEAAPATHNPGKPSVDFQTLKDYDPSIVPELIRNSEAALEELKEKIRTVSGPELIGFIREDIQQINKRLHETESFGVIMTAMNAAFWLNERMQEWLGEKNAADKLSQSLSNNITSEMGLALLNLADGIRPYHAVVEYLKQVKDDGFLDGLNEVEGGKPAATMIRSFLDRYGMRCSGEIDITRPRWSEQPSILVPMILSNIRNFGPGAGQRKFEEGLQEAMEKEKDLLERLKRLPDGEEKAGETKRMIQLVRNLAGYREYPKYSIVSRYFVYKQALLKEAERLVEAGSIHEKEDIFFLDFDELRELVGSKKTDHQLIEKRKEELRAFEKLIPPRVITSDGEIVTGSYKRSDLPAGALPGLAVSSGSFEGRARVIHDIEDADLEEGDILVTAFTDPSWTPLFLSIRGLVTEVGGLMSHGAVIAREYGLAAVVGVENATSLIKDGQRIRVNGTDGYVELL